MNVPIVVFADEMDAEAAKIPSAARLLLEE
jgi:hypothetical protein